MLESIGWYELALMDQSYLSSAIQGLLEQMLHPANFKSPCSFNIDCRGHFIVGGISIGTRILQYDGF